MSFIEAGSLSSLPPSFPLFSLVSCCPFVSFSLFLSLFLIFFVFFPVHKFLILTESTLSSWAWRRVSRGGRGGERGTGGREGAGRSGRSSCASCWETARWDHTAAAAAHRPERRDLGPRPTRSPLSTGGPGIRSLQHRGTVLRAPRPARPSLLRRCLLPSFFPRSLSRPPARPRLPCLPASLRPPWLRTARAAAPRAPPAALLRPKALPLPRRSPKLSKSL